MEKRKKMINTIQFEKFIYKIQIIYVTQHKLLFRYSDIKITN